MEFAITALERGTRVKADNSYKIQRLICRSKPPC